jgi:N4-gp56 family major capsid protein
MAQTKFGVNDPQEVKKWGTDLAVAVNRESYFTSNMASESKRARTPIQIKTDLEKDAGLEVTVDLLMPMGMEPVVQAKLEGRGTPLKYFTDKLRIEQVRGAVGAGDRVTSKATLRNLREDAKVVMKDWWARLQDELHFIYLSGGFGNSGGGSYLWTPSNAMFTVNPITAPDSMHQMFGGNATSLADIGSDDGFDLRLIDRAVAKAETMGGDGSNELSMVPVNMDGKKCYVVLMHTFQYDAMKSNTSVGQWLDIQKAAASATGSNALLFKNSGGMYADCVIHKHRNVMRFNNWGGGSIPGARALFLASQAGVVAYGSSGGSGARYRWTEVMTDHEDQVEIGTHCILGVKKSTYRSKDGQVVRDFGVFAMDTFCAVVA